MTSGWHRADIRAAVEKKGETLTSLALKNGLPDWACRRALRGRHIPGETAISSCIEVPLWVLWPGRWRAPRTPNGKPARIDNRFGKKSRRSAPPRHGQKSKAA
jgi:Ner family transcriptional regulator